MKRKNETLIGHIGVDSGLVMVGDPCYADKDSKDQHPIHDWPSFCDSLKMDHPGPVMKSLNFRLGHEGLGVIVSSGFGDGFYPVYAIVKDHKDWGKRVMSIRIEFE